MNIMVYFLKPFYRYLTNIDDKSAMNIMVYFLKP